MPINGIETAYKDRYTFAPLSQRAVPIQWYTLPLRFISVPRKIFDGSDLKCDFRHHTTRLCQVSAGLCQS